MINKLTKKNAITIIAGPCAIEDANQLDNVCKTINSLGLSWVRGGAFKPRVSPHSFQGLGAYGYDILHNIANKYSLLSLSEVVDTHSLSLALDKKIDAVQIGTRNMTNYSLLKDVGKITNITQCPVLLKRGMSSTVSEWLSAVEYIKENGNNNITLCERGIRTFDNTTRFTLDISAVPVVHKQSNYPICVDVSHAAGNSDIVPSLALAAIASGADAIMIEVHPNPKSAKCDGPQQLNLEQFKRLVDKMQKIAGSLEKELM